MLFQKSLNNIKNNYLWDLAILVFHDPLEVQQVLAQVGHQHQLHLSVLQDQAFQGYLEAHVGLLDLLIQMFPLFQAFLVPQLVLVALAHPRKIKAYLSEM